MIIHNQNPFNAETSLSLVRGCFVTPEEIFFVRNHGRIPKTDAETYRLRVNGLVRRSLNLSLPEIQREFTTRTVAATLQCAGNRRIDFDHLERISGEIIWNAGAIGNAQWTGVPVRQVLEAAGIDAGAAYVEFTGMDRDGRPEMESGFGSSIPLSKAMSDEVLLAYAMNGKPLSREHGFPLRVIVPGYIGARSVKWLREIRVLARSSKNYFQSHAYKIFPSDIRDETADWASGISLDMLPVNSVITGPLAGEEIKAGRFSIQGYAISGGRSIERVELSIDNGETWFTANLLDPKDPWTWRFWDKEMNFEPGLIHLAVRAWDSAAQTQPQDPKKIWNFKGYVNNAWHRIQFLAAA